MKSIDLWTRDSCDWDKHSNTVNTRQCTEQSKSSRTSEREVVLSLETCSRAGTWGGGGCDGVGGPEAAVSSRSSEWVWAGWAEHGGRAEQQDRLLLLGFGQESQRSQTLWRARPTPPGVDMFDNSNYPFNCFNYDGDGYPSSSTEEDKKMCRPAYRYGWFLLSNNK